MNWERASESRTAETRPAAFFQRATRVLFQPAELSRASLCSALLPRPRSSRQHDQLLRLPEPRGLRRHQQGAVQAVRRHRDHHLHPGAAAQRLRHPPLHIQAQVLEVQHQQRLPLQPGAGRHPAALLPAHQGAQLHQGRAARQGHHLQAHALHALPEPRRQHRLPHRHLHRPLLQRGPPREEEPAEGAEEVPSHLHHHLAAAAAAHHPHHAQELRLLQQPQERGPQRGHPHQGRGGQSEGGGLLQPDHHPLHHPGLLHRPHRQPPAPENRRRQDQAEAGGGAGDHGHGGLLPLLPALHAGQEHPAHRPGPELARVHPGQGGRGLRRPDGAVLHGLSAGPAGLLLLQHQVQGHLPLQLLPLPAEGGACGGRQLHGTHVQPQAKPSHLSPGPLTDSPAAGARRCT